jgi:polyhydroxyalkanoate synthase
MALRQDVLETLSLPLPPPVTATRTGAEPSAPPVAPHPMPVHLVEPTPPGSDASIDLESGRYFLEALARTTGASLADPVGVATATAELVGGLVAAGTAAVARAVGRGVPGPVTPGRDARFADPTWEHNAAFWYTRQLQLLGDRFVGRLIDTSPVDDRTRAKASLAAGILSDALSPTNTLLGNPAALTQAFQTGGLSLVRGVRNLAADVKENEGWPRQVDRSCFEVGGNMACTPGEVVYRSALFELIQYAPQTELVHEIPMLFCPPWINKYYIMDLAPGRSLVEWAVQRGHTCFAISYRNPDTSMRDMSFDDYVLRGPLEAVEVVKAITGAEQVNTTAVCLGGTLSAMGMAYDAARGERSVNAATMINTHTDFTRPGQLGAFTDEETVALLERHMARAGLLPSSRMARTFSLLRANDLVFSYVVNNWLMGEDPAAFDLLAWNDDGTNMPGRMHGEFLRWFYRENRFAEGRMEIAGTRLDPGLVDQSTYVVSAVDDHIVPWQSAYQTTQLQGGDDNRFVLSTSGHIAAIVNPPSPKAKHWTNEELPADCEEWKSAARLNEGTWWQDWAGWIAERSGPMVPAPSQLGSERHPPVAAAPGSYVHG